MKKDVTWVCDWRLGKVSKKKFRVVGFAYEEVLMSLSFEAGYLVYEYRELRLGSRV